MYQGSATHIGRAAGAERDDAMPRNETFLSEQIARAKRFAAAMNTDADRARFEKMVTPRCAHRVLSHQAGRRSSLDGARPRLGDTAAFPGGGPIQGLLPPNVASGSKATDGRRCDLHG